MSVCNARLANRRGQKISRRDAEAAEKGRGKKSGGLRGRWDVQPLFDFENAVFECRHTGAERGFVAFHFVSGSNCCSDRHPVEKVHRQADGVYPHENPPPEARVS